jgi:isochorismate synthase
MNAPFSPLDRAPALQASSVHQLCSQWQRGDSLYISPNISLLGQGCLASQALNEAAPRAQERLLRLACQQGLPPLLLGLIGFDADLYQLWVPRQLSSGSGSDGSWPSSAATTASAVAPELAHLQPGPEAYRASVLRAVQVMASGQFDKVVLARSLRLQRRVDLKTLLCAALSRNALGYSFIMNPPNESGALVGASPELLLRKTGNRVTSHPLAGSVPRSVDRQEDQRRAAALLQGAKERREHALVVEAVADSLAPYCSHLDVPTNPSLVNTSTLWHLGTEVRGRLKHPSTSSLELALALHPTPAICGFPRAQALRFIHQHEGFDRAYYGGLLGYCGNPTAGLSPHSEALSDGEWALAIRCAWVQEDAVTLYAGAGLVPGSNPEAELAETCAKLATLLDAMGVSLDVAELEAACAEAIL